MKNNQIVMYINIEVEVDQQNKKKKKSNHRQWSIKWWVGYSINNYRLIVDLVTGIFT